MLYLASVKKCYLYGINVYQPSNNQRSSKQRERESERFCRFRFWYYLTLSPCFYKTFWRYFFVSLFLVAIQYAHTHTHIEYAEGESQNPQKFQSTKTHINNNNNNNKKEEINSHPKSIRFNHSVHLNGSSRVIGKP